MKRRGAALPFPVLCRAHGVPAPLAEYRFALAHGRQWRFDWAWPSFRVALEIDGGGFAHGRHHRPAGFAEDCVKLNTAAIDGWLVVRATPQQVRSGVAFEWLQRALARKAPAHDSGSHVPPA